MTYPVFIASKGRPDCLSAFLLVKDNIPVTIVVEPQDKEKYQARWKDVSLVTLLELPLDNQGLPYVRQFVLDLARKNNFEWYWMLDDDIDNFYSLVPNTTRLEKTTPTTAMTHTETISNTIPNLAIAALEYRQYAWNSKGKIKINNYTDVITLINVPHTRHVNYRTIPLKGDRDFTIQCITTGKKTIRITQYSFNCPSLGTLKGGLHDVYKAKKDQEACEKMIKIWPGITKIITKPNGRPDVKINWKALQQPQDTLDN